MGRHMKQGRPSSKELTQRVKELEEKVLSLTAELEAAKEREVRSQLLLRNVTDVIWIADLNLRLTYVSPSVKELRGFTDSEAIGQTIEQILTPASRQKALELFEEEMAKERLQQGFQRRPRVEEFEQYRKDGSTVWTEVKMVFLRDDAGRPVGILGVTRDITERKKIEKELEHYRASLERLIQERTQELCHTVEQLENEVKERKRAEHHLRLFRYAIEQSSEGVALADLAGNLVFVNQAFAQMHGYRPDELLGRHLSIFHTPEQMSSVETANKEAYEKGSFIGEIWHVRRDGTPFLGAMRNWVLTDEEGRPVGIIGTLRDITERKMIQTALQRSERKYRALYEHLRDGSAAVDLEGRIIEFNPPFLNMLGYTAEEITRLTYKDITPSKWHAMEEEIIREQVMKRGYSDTYEKEYIRKDGAVFPVEITTYLMSGEDGSPQGMWAIVRDITNRKRLQAELLKAQKLESLGILAGGIAHDFNNILTAILTNLSILRTYGNLEADLAQILIEAERACGRARRLGEQLLTFAKGGVPIKKTFMLQSLLRDTTEFVVAGSPVRCEYSILPDLYLVDGDPTQIGQVIYNVVLNAKQAMPHGGTIWLRAENVQVEAGDELPLKPGPYVKVSVKDEGAGIPLENLPRVFDPFFTTKIDGSGLGLATAYAVIKAHGGHIHVESGQDAGTTFYIYLPASEAGQITEPGSPKHPLRRGSGRILVVDDEPTIRRGAQEILKRLGYGVECAEDGLQGIELYKKAMEAGSRFDVVIMDLTIPGGMGGREAIEVLKKIDPEAKVIVSSGFSQDPLMDDFRAYGFCGVLAKPYSLEDLARTLDEVMGVS